MKAPGTKSILLSILWFSAGWVLFYAVVILSMSLNLFSWRLEFDLVTTLSFLTAVLLMPALWLLCAHTRDTLDTWVSFIVVASLAVTSVFAFVGNHQEVISTGFLARTTLSPHWFHLLTSGLLLVPAFFWWFLPFRHWRASRRNSKQATDL